MLISKICNVMRIESSFEKDLVILVDDNDTDLQLNTLILQHIDETLEICCFKTGSSAIDFLRELKEKDVVPKLMLLDLKMANLNGLEVIEIIQKENLKNFPVVILSGSSLPEDYARARQVGADEHCEKPLSYSENIELFNELIAKYIHQTIPYLG